MKDLPNAVATRVATAEVAVRAPGRANLIGEHTDYNEGFVLPVALDLETYVVGDRVESRLTLSSDREHDPVTVDLTTGEGPEQGWGRYVTAVVRALKEWDVPLHGLVGTVSSAVPVGAGLSSSAALEVAVAYALTGGALDPPALAIACRRAENHYVGVQSGIMDQLTSTAARRGHACLIDCRDNSLDQVPIPDNVEIVVIDSGIRRSLADSAYNDRRRECEEAAAALGVGSLRDARIKDLDRLAGRPVLQRRARHIVTENRRTLDAAVALSTGDFDSLRELFRASHDSYANDFEASLPEIDDLVAIADRTEGVLGARLTGGGWGGCVVALVTRDEAGECAAEIVDRYESATSRVASFWVSEAADGVSSLK